MSETTKRPLVTLVYAFLVLGTLAVFWQVRDFEFLHYDDHCYVHQNSQVLRGLTWDGVVWAFTTGYASNWHPMTWLSHMLDCTLFGPDPGRMHLVNVFLHLASTLLLFTILWKTTGALWRSGFVAAAFALHPMHVESVAWIAERKDVLSTFFLLLALGAYVSYVKRRSISRYLASLAFFALGLMAKPMLVTLPFLLLLLDYWPLNRFDVPAGSGAGRPKRRTARTDGRWPVFYRIIAEKIPFFVLAAVSSAVTFLVQRAGGAVAESPMLSLDIRIANALLSYTKYIGKVFWPRNLAVFYPLDPGRFAFWQVAASFLLLFVVSVLVVRLGRERKYLPVGWFWFVGTLVPVIGLVQVGMQAMANRYTYVPYLGIFIMIAWGLPEFLPTWPHRKAVLGLLMITILAALGICAHRQVSYWRNGVALFSQAIEVTDDNYVAYFNRATAYNKRGLWQEAMQDYLESIKTMPDDAKSHYDLGFVYGKLNRWQEAVGAFDEAIRLKPDFADAYSNRGAAYGELGLRQEAIASFRKAVELDPNSAEAHHNLANELLAAGGYDEAVEQYRKVLSLTPDGLASMNNLAWLIATCPGLKNRDPNEAIQLAERMCELTGHQDPAFLDTLAGAYASAGRFT